MTTTTKINLFFLILANSSLVALSLIDNGRGPLYPYILELFSFSGKQGSWFFSLATIFSLLSYILARFWLKPLGVIRSSVMGVLILALSSFGLAVSVYMQSSMLLYFFSALLGIGIAFCSSTMNILVVQGTTVDVRRRYLAALHAVYGLSSFAAPLLLSFLLFCHANWKSYFLVTAVISFMVFAYGLYGYLLHHSSKIQSPTEGSIDTSKKDESRNVPWFPRIFFPTVIGLCVGGEIAISTRLPQLMEHYYRYDTHFAGLSLSIFFCLLMIGRMLLAINRFKVSSENLLTACLLLSLFFFFCGHFIHPLGYSLIGLSIGPFFPTAMDFLSQRFEEQYEVMATAVLTAVGLSMSAMHFLFGVCTDWWGIDKAFLLVPLLFTLSLLLFLLGRLPRVKTNL